METIHRSLQFLQATNTHQLLAILGQYACIVQQRQNLTKFPGTGAYVQCQCKLLQHMLLRPWPERIIWPDCDEARYKAMEATT